MPKKLISLDELRRFKQKEDNYLMKYKVDIGITPLNIIGSVKAWIKIAKTWNTEDSQYLATWIKVNPGDTVVITPPGNIGYYAVLTDYPNPVNNDAVPLSSATGFTDKVSFSSKTTIIMPSDAKYLWIATHYSSSNVFPTSVTLNGLELVRENGLQIAEDDILSIILTNGFQYTPTTWNSGSFIQTVGQPTSPFANSARQNTPRQKCPFPLDITIVDGYSYVCCEVDENDIFIGYINATGSTYTDIKTTIPANKLFRIIVRKNDNSNLTGLDMNDYITLKNYALTGQSGSSGQSSSYKWCALGDSITEGWISTNVSPYYAYAPNEGWVKKLAEITGWDVTNRGIGGTGFLREHSGENDAAWKVVSNIDFSQYDFITIAYGVNDWKYDMPLGTFNDSYSTPTTIYGAIRKTLETIISSNPLAKIFVILPINCSAYGTEENDWGKGYSFPNNGTLKQVCEAIKYCCDYYGIQYIDMLNTSIVNRKNINNCLLDGVHPTPETHTVMSHELGAKITWK